WRGWWGCEVWTAAPCHPPALLCPPPPPLPPPGLPPPPPPVPLPPRPPFFFFFSTPVQGDDETSPLFSSGDEGRMEESRLEHPAADGYRRVPPREGGGWPPPSSHGQQTFRREADGRARSGPRRSVVAPPTGVTT